MAEVTVNTMDAVTDGRSILPEDAEGWILGPGTGAGAGAGPRVGLTAFPWLLSSGFSSCQEGFSSGCST